MTASIAGRRHRAVLVEVGSRREEIDEAIAPLIHALWMAGVPTLMSCQETDPGFAWIEFEELDHLGRFLSLVAVHKDGADTMYNRIAHARNGPSATPPWEYRLNPLDCGGDGTDDRRPGRKCDFLFTVGVYIPHADLPAVRDRLERHNRRHAAVAVRSAEG
jgi:hypothetical protein